MAIEFRQSFGVKAPADRVWEFLTDPRRAAGALPGATFTEQVDETTFRGTMTVKLGPMTTQYRGEARFERQDPAERVIEIVGVGQDVKGRGGAEMRMTGRLVERAPSDTEVSVAAQVDVTGILAQLGRGMIQDVSDQLFEQFTTAVRAELEAPEPGAGPVAAPATEAAAIDAAAFGAQVARRVARRWARKPAFWVGVAAVVAVICWLLLR